MFSDFLRSRTFQLSAPRLSLRKLKTAAAGRFCGAPALPTEPGAAKRLGPAARSRARLRVPLLVCFNGMAKQGALKIFYAGVSHQQSVEPIIFWTFRALPSQPGYRLCES